MTVEKNKLRQLFIVVPIETYGTADEHEKAVNAVYDVVALEVRRHVNDRARFGLPTLASWSVARLSKDYDLKDSSLFPRR